jgi:hypothetical protein
MIILVYVDKSPHIIYVQFNTLSEEIESKKIQCDFNSAQLNKNSFKASYRNTLCWEMIRIQDYKDKWDSQQRRSRSLKVLPSSNAMYQTNIYRLKACPILCIGQGLIKTRWHAQHGLTKRTEGAPHL